MDKPLEHESASTLRWTLNNGVTMPLLGMGTVDFEASEAAAIASLVFGLEVGYRTIDTAAIYKNEHVVGKALQQTSVPREDIFVTTKVWNEDVRKDRVAEAFEESLEKLQLDYVDLYLVHWPIVGKLQESWKEMEKILAGGKARAIGVSNYQTHHLDEIAEVAEVTPALNQVEFSPLFQQKELRAYCDQRDILLQAWKPFIGGKVFGNEVIAGLAAKHGRSEAQIILRWSIQEGISTIPKSATRERIESNAQIFDFALSDEDMTAIQRLDTGQRLGSDPDNFDF